MSETETKIFDLEVTASNLPAIWETGGGWSNTGRARIITDRNGNPKTALCLRHRCNEDHALFILHEDDVIIEAWQHRGDYDIILWKVDKISLADGKAVASAYKLAEYHKGCWSVEPRKSFTAAICAAMDKSIIYHCRNAVWYKERKKGEAINGNRN